MAREGMDVGLVTGDGTKMKAIGETSIPEVISSVNSIVTRLQSEWWGPDSTAFVQNWESTDRPNLTTIAQEISSFGQLAVANAQAQSSASSQ